MRAMHRLSILGLVLIVGAGIAYAGFSNPADAVTYRKSVMHIIGYHFKSMGAMIQGKMAYDKAAFEKDANIVAAAAESAAWADALADGSAIGPSHLKPSALKNKAAFLAIANNLGMAAANLAVAAKRGDMGAIKLAFGETAKNCKDCHGSFKK